jgi:hypothetical protein
MSIKITIPNTSSDVLTFGSANTPTAAQIAGIDSGSSNGQLALYTTASGTSTERVRVDASGNVGIGTSSPSQKLDVIGNIIASNSITIGSSGLAQAGSIYSDTNWGMLFYAKQSSPANADFAWLNSAGTERARITSGGDLLVGLTSISGANGRITTRGVTGTSYSLRCDTGVTTPDSVVAFSNPNGVVGTVSTNGSATAYNTSSDYRLKNTIAPMTGALAKVALLKPCTYKWNADGSDGEGFIAHELAEVAPYAVSGEKDAVDAEGKPQYQGIDTSFLVATLTAAIKEMKAIIDAQASTITQLQADVAALKGASA